MAFGIGDLWNLITGFAERVRTLGVGIAEVLKRLTTSAGAFFASAAVAGKAGYDKVTTYITELTASMSSLNVQTIGDGWSGANYLAFANYVFPLSELLAGLIIVAEFWVFCLIFKMNWHFRRQIRFGG